MKIERTKNATRNIIFGAILNIYQIAVPFAMRTAMIYLLGIQYLGLNSLFTSILQVLNLAELGVGSAMVFSMYKPIAEDDHDTICALMRLYKIYYQIIGMVVFVFGMILLPFIPKLITGNIPKGINIYILYLLNLGATVLSYWLFAYKNCLLTASQRTDVTSKITLVTNSFQYIFQFLVMFIFKNYYYYLIVALFTQALTNILTSIVATKMYPDFRAVGILDSSISKAITQRVKDVFTAKVGGVVTNSVDTLVISAFLGLTVLAEYNNYYYIMSSVFGFVGIIFTSCTAGIGNSLVKEKIEKNYRDFKMFTFVISWIIAICTCCLLCLYQPFMRLWIGKKLMLDNIVVVLLCVYFYVYEITLVFAMYKDAGGIWHEDRFRPLVVSLVNLILNISMVKVIGIYGILISTIISYICVGMPWMIRNIFKILFKRNAMEYILKILLYAFITVVACVISYFVCELINVKGIIGLGIDCIIAIFVPNLIFFISFIRTEEFSDAKIIVNKFMGNLLHP
ncbi:MAG: polysaccharide biosynthesis protein [Clostridium sp.]|nr:polysaccharide biosynthesis protein [Clostridium sp.]